MLLFVEILASLTENFWAVYIPGKLAGKRVAGWRYSCIAVICLTVCVSIINRYILFSVFTSAVGVLLMALVSVMLYRMKFGEALFMAAAYIAAVYIFDFLVLALLGTVLGNPDYASMVADKYSCMRMWFLIISKGGLCCACSLFLNNCGRFRLQQFDRWPWLLLGMMVLYYLVNGTLLQSDMGALISWLLLLAVLVLGAYAVLQHFITRAQKERMALEMELGRMKRENYERFMEDYRRNQIFYHDLKNHYLVLKAHLANREYERAEAYIDNLVLPPGTEPLEGLTGIESLDILMAYKRSEAEKRGIRVNITAEPVSLRLTEAESVALFGNLLDNAIEAYDYGDTGKAGDMEDTGERQISVTIRQIRDMQFIKITNLCQGEPGKGDGKENGIFQTKKADKRVHGIGLRSAAAIAEKYGGILKADYIEGQFSVIISFFDSREQ